MGEMPMPVPVTALDEEYSDPAATATGWEETRRALEMLACWVPWYLPGNEIAVQRFDR
jgi:hypothetical protein